MATTTLIGVPTTICFVRYVGNTKSFGFTLKDSAGVAIDITSYTFAMTLNSEEFPINADNEKFAMVGSIVDAATGKFKFTPSQPNADSYEAGNTWFFDVEVTDAGGDVGTFAIGTVAMRQGVTQ